MQYDIYLYRQVIKTSIMHNNTSNLSIAQIVKFVIQAQSILTATAIQNKAGVSRMTYHRYIVASSGNTISTYMKIYNAAFSLLKSTKNEAEILLNKKIQ